MSVVDTSELISEQIYEQMKYLHTVFRKRMKAALDWSVAEKSDMAILMFSYSIMKACRLDAVLEEKYFETGEIMFQNVLENRIRKSSSLWECDNSKRDYYSAVLVSLLMMGEGERIRKRNS